MLFRVHSTQNAQYEKSTRKAPSVAKLPLNFLWESSGSANSSDWSMPVYCKKKKNPDRFRLHPRTQKNYYLLPADEIALAHIHSHSTKASNEVEESSPKNVMLSRKIFKFGRGQWPTYEFESFNDNKITINYSLPWAMSWAQGGCDDWSKIPQIPISSMRPWPLLNADGPRLCRMRPNSSSHFTLQAYAKMPFTCKSSQNPARSSPTIAPRHNQRGQWLLIVSAMQCHVTYISDYYNIICNPLA